MKHFDVVVIGGGHAGVEAAASAARMGAQAALVTMDASKIGTMSCNPAIGGLGKGHLVREIDALDGLMGLAADAAGIQFRLLNRRKGPAVQGPRAQTDRKLYRRAIQALLAAEPNLTILSGEVVDLVMRGGSVSGCVLSDGTMIQSRAVVLTAGTFLNGVMHIGDQKQEGGRVGDAASTRLAGRLAELCLERGRLKTGTPPRLDGKTINWSLVDRQPGDQDPVLFSFLSIKPAVAQVECGITHTNERTHEIVRANLSRSAMYGGHIEGVGPRYCPSIEDKVVRFADKSSHQVYLEPEGLDDDTVYPNGISSSLPLEVQEAYVRSIRGLEEVRILQPAYAIEYDFFDPRGLTPDLQVQACPGLYFAGQINGTTGYEEAAAQGLLAGACAAAAVLGRAIPRFAREESYIGVLTDDLLNRGVTEPYRMFTSRAEYRLSLRADNADQRLTPFGRDHGLVRSPRWEAYCAKAEKLGNARDMLSAARFSPTELAQAGIHVSGDGARRNGFFLLSMPDVTVEQVAALVPAFGGVEGPIQAQIGWDALYAQYLERQSAEYGRLASADAREIPPDFDYTALAGLSNELKGKLLRLRPSTMAEAGRIEGMTPAALTLILANLKRLERLARDVA